MVKVMDVIFEADKFVEDLDLAYEQVQQAIQKAQEKQKKAADKHRRRLHFKEGDWISEVINDVSYRLSLPASWKIHNAFHVSLLRQFVGELPDQPEDSPQPEVDELDEVLQPDQILAHKERRQGGTKVVVVFDAGDSGLPDHKESHLGIDVVFSASVTADSWIEREVELLRTDGCPKVWVVTSDHLQQQCAHASGAFVWSCKFLVAAIKDAKKERDQLIREMTCYSTKGKLLEHNLNPEVCSALKTLKQQLLQAEAG
ncbi:hypothetical protein L7F22_062463 [Adiantum nelumboides]|nr:hypothetical protein [Adiantum nelumboides]